MSSTSKERDRAAAHPVLTPIRTSYPNLSQMFGESSSSRAGTPELMSSTSTAPSSIVSTSSRKPSWDFEHESIYPCEAYQSSPRVITDNLDLEELLENLSIPDIPIDQKSSKSSTKIFEVIGEGSHARVHRASLHGRQVAAKVANAKYFDAFIRREVEALDYICTRSTELDHIVEHYALDTINGRATAFYELAELNLWQHIRAEAKLSPLIAPACGHKGWSNLALQIVEGVAALHALGVVHGDLKVGNVILTTGDVPKLIDFESAYTPDGSLKLPESNGQDIVGTNAYSAPELLRGRETRSDFATDVFALGVLLLVLATAEEPYSRARNGIEMIIQGQHGDPIRFTSNKSRISPLVERVVRACCAKDPARRWTAEEVLHFLQDQPCAQVKHPQE